MIGPLLERYEMQSTTPRRRTFGCIGIAAVVTAMLVE
jgi:hypothetical protein